MGSSPQNDHNGDMDGRVALTETETRLIVAALSTMEVSYPDAFREVDGHHTLRQMIAVHERLKAARWREEGGDQCG